MTSTQTSLILEKLTVGVRSVLRYYCFACVGEVIHTISRELSAKRKRVGCSSDSFEERKVWIYVSRTGLVPPEVVISEILRISTNVDRASPL